jgi:hypothetical protein
MPTGTDGQNVSRHWNAGGGRYRNSTDAQSASARTLAAAAPMTIAVPSGGQPSAAAGGS